MSRNSNNHFRLIAVRTGDSLTKTEELVVNPNSLVRKQNLNFLKLLKANTPYYLFDCFRLSQNGEKLTYFQDKDLTDLYSLKNNEDVNIEVSGIVGKNGSGKSTLLEIIYLAIHNLSVFEGILLDDERQQVRESYNYLRCSLYIQISEGEFLKLDFRFDDDEQYVHYYSGTLENNVCSFDNRIDSVDFNLKRLFYSIVVNYSIYGLNSSQIGHWIDHLFHKNDSYQAPIVINPMRTAGNFDINREEYFTRTRLLSNSIVKFNKSDEVQHVTDSQVIHEVFFKLNEDKIAFLEEDEDPKKDKVVLRSIQDLVDESGFSTPGQIVQLALGLISGYTDSYTHVDYFEQVELYIVKKLYKIASTYAKYDFLDYKYFEDKGISRYCFSKGNFTQLLVRLKTDNSHVTIKLRQALNYLRFNPLHSENNRGWFGLPEIEKFYKIPFIELATRIHGLGDSVINCLPPSIFETFINVKNIHSSEISDLQKLSSGELQLINSVQSTLYHLNNLDSYKGENDNVKKIIYSRALIIVDEIELYFHPEFQRKMITYLLEEIDALNLELIKSIHILFVTHSPFILSDIPRSNLLKLEDGTPRYDKDLTFAGNIYEMLKDSFFLSSATGEFAIEVINDLLGEMNSILDLKKHPRENKVKLTRKVDLLSTSNALKIIDNIGDRVIRVKMQEMYDDCVGSKKIIKQARIQEEIDRLNKKLDELN